VRPSFSPGSTSMVAIVSAGGLGLDRSSALVLGSRGVIGQAGQGRANDNVYVNAATGNLLIQNTDETLFGLGAQADLAGRTYNSLGVFSDGYGAANGSWAASGSRTVGGLTGTLNSAGSTVTRVDSDGSNVVFTWNSLANAYTAKEGGGALDTLTYSSVDSTWIWTNGTTRYTEVYDTTHGGRIVTGTDANANVTTYSYNANGFLATVTMADGGHTDLVYDTNNLLTQIVTTYKDASGNYTTLTRVRYGYDSSNRLATVMVDLSPSDNSIADGKTYVTTYGYDSASNRVSSVTQSDGSQLQIGYTLVGSAYRVSTLTQTAATGVTRVTTLSYNTTTRATTITDPAGQVTTLVYDTSGQLTQLTAPPPVAGGASQVYQYTYDANGDVLTANLGPGNTITYTYDSNGNLLSQLDSAGNAITRTFGVNNELLTETHYLTPDPDGTGSLQPAAPITTRYAYDADNNLGYIVSAEGDVTQYLYNALGQRVSEITFTADRYDVSALSATTAISKSTLDSWVVDAGRADPSTRQRTDTTYDFRGNISTVTSYGKVLSSGLGDATATTEITKVSYIYDQAGRLLSRQPVSSATAETYLYDGLGRIVSNTDFDGNTTSIQFNDASSTTVITLANGLTKTSTYDLAGELIGYAESASDVAIASTAYKYDSLGRLRIAVDPTGLKTYYLYDNIGRKVADILADGTITEYGYNANDRLIFTEVHANKLTSGQLASLVDANGNPSTSVTLASVRPSSNAADRWTWSVYDNAQRLIETIDAAGAATVYTYDGASRLVSTIAYANLIGASTVSGFKTTPPSTLVLPTADANNDRLTRNFYDGDGHLAGSLDAEGYLSQIFYDAAGQKVHTVKYATAATAGLRASGTLAQLLTSVGTSAGNVHGWFVYDQRGFLRATIDGEGDLTRYHYTALGDVDQVISGQIVDPAALLVTPPTLANLPNPSVGVILDSTTYTRNGYGQLLTVTRTLGSGTETDAYVYDSQHRLVSMTTASNTADARTTTYRYDSRGRLIGKLTGVGSAALAALGASPTPSQVNAVYATYGTIYAYDTADRLIAMTQPDGATAAGNQTLYFYDVDGQLTYQVNALGEVTQYGYDTFGGRSDVTVYGNRLSAATVASLASGQSSTGGQITAALTAAVTAIASSPIDSHTHTNYNVTGTVLSAVDALNATTSYGYNAFRDLVSITDPLNIVTTRTYDRRGLMLSTALDSTGLNLITAYKYDAFGEKVQATDPLGSITSSAYDRAGRLVSSTDALSKVTAFTYDGRGNLLSTTDRTGKTTSYTYDAFERTVTSTDPNGVTTSTQTNAEGQTVKITDGASNQTIYAYDADGNLVSVTDPLGHSVQNQYDNAGRLSAVTDKAGAVTRYAYDAANRLIFTVDAMGDVAASTYDTSGRVIATRSYAAQIPAATLATLPLSVTAATITGNVTTSANDEVTSFVYDVDGRLRYTVDANGRPTEYIYDADGQLLHKTEYAGNIASGTYALAYVQAQISANNLGANAAVRTTRYVYDKAGREAFCIDAQGAVTAYVYDAAGNMVKKTEYATIYTTSGDQSLSTMQSWASGHITSNDRISRSVFDANGQVVYGVDAESYLTEYRYDAEGRVTAEIRFADRYTVSDGATLASVAALAPAVLATTVSLGTLPSTAATTTYSYDADGQLTDTVDPLGIVTHLVRDALGRTTDSTIAYGTADAATTHTVYDTAGRITSQTAAYGTPAASTTSYTYDGAGRALTVTDGDGYVTTRTYDAMGRVLTVSVPLSSTTAALTTNQYDAFGNLVAVTDPRGNTGYFYYDALNRLKLQVDPEGFATATNYSIGDQVTSVTRYVTRTSGAAIGTLPTITPGSADATTTIVRDKLDRVTATTDATNISESYALSAFGDRVTVTNKLGGVTTNTYDKRGQLLSEILPIKSTRADGTVQANSVTNTYVYDARGNRTRMVEASGLTEQRTTNYVYDKADRLIQTIGDTVQTVGTDLATTTGISPTQTNVYDNRDNVIESDDASGARTLSYYDQANRKIAQVDALGALTQWTYDANGNVLTQTVYGDFVTLPATPGGAPPAPLNASNCRLTSYVYDRNNRLVSTTISGVLIGSYNGSAYQASTSDLISQTAYDASGNIVQTIDGNGNSTYFYYDRLGHKTGQVDPLGYLTTYALDQDGNVTTETRYATALAAGFSASVLPTGTSTADDRVTVFTYDKNGRRLTESRLNVTSYTVDSNGALSSGTTTAATITYTYNGLGEITSKTEATGDQTSYVYDGMGRQTSVTKPLFSDYTGAVVQPQTLSYYDGLGNLTRTTVGNVGAAVSADHVTTYTYGAGGRLASMTDASGFVRSYGYDAEGRVVKESYSRVKSDGTSVTEANAYRYDALGRTVFQSTAGLGGSTWTFGDQTQTQYDTYGEVIAKGVNGGWQESYAYDSAGRVSRSNAGDGTTKFFLYDGAGNQTLEISSAGTDLSGYSTVSAIALLTNNGANAIGGALVAGVNATINVYDARGQQTETREPFRELNASTSNPSTNDTALIDHQKSYNAFGEVASQTDARGNQTIYSYNTMGKLVSTVLPAVSVTDETGAINTVHPTVTNYYDISGRLLGMRDANGNLDTRQVLAGTGYGGADPLVTAQYHPDGGREQTLYDVFGDARFYVTPMGGVETRLYDAMDRLISVTHPTYASSIRLTGTSGADKFDTVGAGYEQGNGGADTFVYAPGRGFLEISEDNNFSASTAALQIGPGLTASQITVTSDSGGNLYLSDGINGDQIKLDNQLNAGHWDPNEFGVVAVNFADGTSLTRQQLVDLATTGTAANTSLYGTVGNNVFDSKGLAYYAQGRQGTDTFIFKSGYGPLEINVDNLLSGPSTSVIQMGPGITASQISVTSDTSGNMYLTDGVLGDQIKLDGQLNYGSWDPNEFGIATINFADGTSLTRQQLADMAATGTAANTSLFGSAAANTFDSNGFAHYIQSRGGADTFIYKSGYGPLEINEDSGTGTAVAVLQMGPGITASQIGVTSDGNGHLYMTTGVAGDQIKLDFMLNSNATGVAAVNFADGTSLTRQQLIAMATVGTAANVSLYGSSGADIFDSAGHATYAQGNGGADTFIYNNGYGPLEIYAYTGGLASTSVLQMGAGITASQLIVTSDSNGHLYLRTGGAGDQIQLDYALNSNAYGVASVSFSNGTSLTRQQLITMATTGTAANRILDGTTGADTFDSGGFATYARGNGGADTFIYNSGYGPLEIYEYTGGAASTAVLQMGPGLTASQMSVTKDGANNLYLADGVTGDQIKIDYALISTAYGVASVNFSDGTSLTRQQLINMATTGGSSIAQIAGTSGADTLDSHGRATYVAGNGGSDTFVYNLGYGQIEIYENSTTAVLQMGTGITISQLIVTGDPSGDIYLTNGVTGDQVKLDYETLTNYGVSTVNFSDGTSLTRQQLINMATTGTAGNRRLYGSGGADTFDSGGFANYARGAGGTDTFVYNAGYGQLEIDEGGSTTSILQMGTGITASQIVVTSDSSGDLFLSDGISGDRIKLDFETSTNWGVATVTFTSGATLTRQQLINMAATGTAANRSLNGSNGADTFDSGGFATYARGNGGADIFIYNQGYGQLEIDESSNAAVLQFGTGISASQISVTSSTNDLFLTDGVTGDRIKIDWGLITNNGITTVNFADGTSWTRQQLIAKAAIGTSANRSLNGTGAAEVFDSGGFAKYAQGDGGADTFVYNPGYGQLEIYEDNGGASTAILQMGAGLTAAQMNATSDGTNIYLTDGILGDRIKLDYAISGARYGVASVNFADGTTISRDQLVAMANANVAMTDNYSYDGLGERLKHWNNQLGSGVTETTDYDSQGRIVRQKDFDGYITTYGFTYNGSMATTGLGTFGGWTQTTTNTSGLTATKQVDYFGRTVGGTDFGGHTSNLTFDGAGRLAQQTSTAGQNIQYTYFNTGSLATSSDYVASSQQFPRNMVTSYGYDVAGNRLSETYTGTYTVYDYVLGLYQVTTSFENAVVTYDALNRMITFQDSGQDGAHPVTVAYEYDADGNVRHMLSTYKDLVTNSNTVQDYWYRYDSVNRFVTTEGQLLDSSGHATTTRGTAGNHIARGATGTEITYDATGNRATAVSASDSESYKYTANGYLSAVYIDGVLRAQDVRDGMGRVISHTEYGTNGKVVYSKIDTYDAKSQVLTEQTSTVQSDGSTMVANTTYDYKADVGGGNYTGAYQGGNVTHSRTTNTRITSGGSSSQPTTDTANSYVWWEQAEQSVITYKPDITQSATNTSTFAYDASGHLTTVTIQDGRPRTVSYVTDAAGQILSRVEASSASSNPIEYYYDFNGIRVGQIGNNGPSQTNYAAAISARSQASPTGPFANGSAQSFADFDQSYDMLNPYAPPEAGVSQTYKAQAGDTLQSIALAVWGDSNLWYLIAEANGLRAENALLAGQDIIIPTKVANYHNDASTFRVYDPNKALGNVQPTAPRPSNDGGCGIFGQIIKAIVSIVVTIVTAPFAGPFAPVLGDLAGQTFALATGIQSSFNWKELGMVAATSAVDFGLSETIPEFAALSASTASVGEVALHNVALSAVSQGVEVATGLQKHFDWTAVAAAGISGGLSRAVSSNLSGYIGSDAGAAVGGMAGGIANAAARSLVSGTDFGDNIIAALPDILSQTVGNVLAVQFADRDDPRNATADKPVQVAERDQFYNGDTATDASIRPSETVTVHGNRSTWGDIGNFLGDVGNFVEGSAEFVAGLGVGAVKEAAELAWGTVRTGLDVTLGIPVAAFDAVTGVHAPDWVPNVDHVTQPLGQLATNGILYAGKVLSGQANPVSDIGNAISDVWHKDVVAPIEARNPFQAGENIGAAALDVGLTAVSGYGLVAKGAAELGEFRAAQVLGSEGTDAIKGLRLASAFETTEPVLIESGREWQSYEDGVRDLYGAAPLKQRQYTAFVNGDWVNGKADNVTMIDGKSTAIDAKYVDDWNRSLRNPASPGGQRPWAIEEQQEMISQAQKYTAGFEGGVIYHTNSVELASYYSSAFRQAGVTNFRFVITPATLK